MNILMINYEYPPLGGGGGVVSKMLAEALINRHNITVITSRFGHQALYETVNGVELIRTPVLFRSDRNAATIISMLAFFPASLWIGLKLLRKRKYDVIHSMFAIPSAPSGLLLAKIFRKPHLLTVFGGDIYDPSKKLSPHRTPILHQTVENVLYASDRVVTMSEDIRRRTKTYYYRAPKEIFLIKGGIPKPIFTPSQRSDYGFDDEDILLITIGRLVPRKAVHKLIQVIKLLGDARVKLIVIGDGPERGMLEQTAIDLNVKNQIFFGGNVDENAKFALLNFSDIYVSTSQHEGFGLVFLEAMSVGLPIVCYDNGGQTDFLKDGETGVLVELGNRAAFADKLRALIVKPALRTQMETFNRRYIHEFFIENIANQYEKQYRALAE
ncbi:glycosyltransferase family 4 protein [Desulfococcaceae bacterium HSG7]|nr:glycosyltransferase family 4 protein [Desulfococcaceae bacterium HSG7]